MSGEAGEGVRGEGVSGYGVSRVEEEEEEEEEEGVVTLHEAGCRLGGMVDPSNTADSAGLLSIKATFVNKECPEFASKYNSVS